MTFITESHGFSQLVFEFTRQVGINLNGRSFEYSEERPLNATTVACRAGAEVIIQVLPDLAKNFASSIKGEWTKCYKIGCQEAYIEWNSTAHNPANGLSIHGVKYFDIENGDTSFQFRAAFS